MAKKRKLENNKSQIDLPQEEEEEQQQVLEESDPEEEDSAPPPITATNTNQDDQSEDDEPIQNLLQPFTKEQLLDLLNQAATSHSDVLDRIKTLADVDPVHRKIFVHGLGWDTTAETLNTAFSQYGEIEDCKHVIDKVSGKSKGYAFILFKHRSGARKALKEPQKKIGNRTAACQMASAGPVHPPVQAGPPVSEYTQRKIFVSNVSSDIDTYRLHNFFSKYGEIVEGPLGLDKQTGKPKGFALFVFKTIESAKKALEEPQKSFEGHILHVQKAVDGPKIGKMHHQSPGSNFGRNGNIASMGSHDMGGGQAIASPVGMGFNHTAGAAPPAAQLNAAQLNPIGQALTALLATQGGALELANLLSTGVNPSVPPVVNNVSHGLQAVYGNQPSGNQGFYGNHAVGSSNGNLNFQMGHNNAGRPHHGGYMGGGNPYMGH